jgi:hypothetical protein
MKQARRKTMDEYPGSAEAIKIFSTPPEENRSRLRRAYPSRGPSTPEEKIQELLDQIDEDFPNGCDLLDCDDCQLNHATNGTMEQKVCELMMCLGARSSFTRKTQPMSENQ